MNICTNVLGRKPNAFNSNKNSCSNKPKFPANIVNLKIATPFTVCTHHVQCSLDFNILQAHTHTNTVLRVLSAQLQVKLSKAKTETNQTEEEQQKNWNFITSDA